MRRIILILTLILCQILAYGQDRLVPASPRIDYMAPNKHQVLEKEYLLGGNGGGFEASYAFGGGYALTYSKGILFYSNYDKIDLYHLLNDSIMDVAYPEYLHRYKMAVPDSILLLIDNMIEAAVNTSSYLYEHYGCDGTMYYFTASHTASCWSPGGRCGDLVNALYRCGQAVSIGCLDSVLAVMPECRRLIRSFRKDYPVGWNDYPIGFYIRDNNGRDWDATRDYKKKYKEELEGISRRLFTETDCALEWKSFSIENNGQDNYRLTVERDFNKTLYLDSTHFVPEQIYDVAQHIGLFEPGEYRYNPESESFNFVDSLPKVTERESNYEDCLEDADNDIQDDFEDKENDRDTFPLLNVTDKNIYRILGNAVRFLDKKSMSGNIISMSYNVSHWSITRSDSVLFGFPLGYFEWKGQKVFVLHGGYVDCYGNPLKTDLKNFTKINPKGERIFISKNKRPFWEPNFYAFTIDKGSIRTFIGPQIEEEAYKTAINQILEKKGLIWDEVYISSSLTPIPKEFTQSKKLEFITGENYTYRPIPPYESPVSKLDALVEKAIFKLSEIDNGYFVIRYEDQQGNREYYRFQIEKDYSVTSLE